MTAIAVEHAPAFGQGCTTQLEAIPGAAKTHVHDGTVDAGARLARGRADQLEAVQVKVYSTLEQPGSQLLFQLLNHGTNQLFRRCG